MSSDSSPSTSRIGIDETLHSIEIEYDDEEIAFDTPKNFYLEGTTSGWINKNQTCLLFLGAAVFIILGTVLIGTTYVTANNDDTFDDEDCWPFSCESYDEATVIEAPDSYYYEHSGIDDFDFSSWAFRLPSPTNRDLYAITYFELDDVPYHFVAVGEESSLLVSMNGKNWTLLDPIEPQM